MTSEGIGTHIGICYRVMFSKRVNADSVLLCRQRNEYWRLKDAEGKPPGLVGWWPSRSVLFLENHDTVR